MSENSRAKLANLAKELSEFYPCEIQIHICYDDIFQGLPKWAGTHSAFYRILIPKFMPQNLTLCLYLDVDMLVRNDLRHIFTLNMENKYLGVAGLVHRDYYDGLYAKNPQDENFYFDGFQFNSGFLLFNLNEWKKHNLKDKILDFAGKYEVMCPDQDSLNAIVNKEYVLILPYEYNMIITYYYHNSKIFLYRRQYLLNFYRTLTIEQIDFAHKNPMVWHYITHIKPWNNELFIGTDENGKVLELYWWQVAFQTPFFKDELKRLFTTKKENYLICKEFGLYIASLINEHSKSFLGYIKMPFVVWRAFKEFDLTKNDDYVAKADTNLDKNLAFEFLYVATKAWGQRKQSERIFQFVALPYKIYRAKCRCQKGNFRAQKKSVYHKLYIT